MTGAALQEAPTAQAPAQAGGVRLPRSVARLVMGATGAVIAFLVFTLGWAMTADLSTTVRVGGVLSPLAPSFEVQHDTGGQVAAIHVALHDEVQNGQLLMTLDTTNARAERDALELQIAGVLAELDEIGQRLGDGGSTPGGGHFGTRALDPNVMETEAALVADHYAAQDAILAAQVTDAVEQRAANNMRLLELDREDQMELRLHDLTQRRLARIEGLGARGLVPRDEVEALQHAALQSEATRLAIDARRQVLADDTAALERQMTRLNLDYQGRMAERRVTLVNELAAATARLTRVDRTIDLSEIRAPVAGKITDIGVATPGMVAPPSTTLLTLTQPQLVPKFDLFVPPEAIDQVRVGQSGLLTITALPQRDAPRLDLTITDIAREPVRDRDGASLHYRAVGVVAPQALAVAREEMGERFQLQVGMPINVALEGRPTTLWSFVTGPFTGLLSTAFED